MQIYNAIFKVIEQSYNVQLLCMDNIKDFFIYILNKFNKIDENEKNEIYCTFVLNSKYVRWVILNDTMYIKDVFDLADKTFNNSKINYIEINDIVISRKCKKRLTFFMNDDDTIRVFT